MEKIKLLLEGIISYRTATPIRSQYDSFFLLPNGYIGEIGLHTSQKEDLYLVHYTDKEGVTRLKTNIPDLSPQSSLPAQLLGSTPNLRIGVWFDERSNQLRLARDLFRPAPLFYSYLPGEYFAFSTDISRLVRMAEVAKQTSLNVGKIILHNSSHHTGFVHDASSTFFSSVQCVLPGHILTVNDDSCRSQTYVQFHPEKWSGLRSNPDYHEALRDSFKNAVKQCIPNEGRARIGSHLSGGLDSSSVVSMARYLYQDADLHTFHVTSKSKETSEIDYADTVAREMHTSHHLVTVPPDHLAAMELASELFGQPDSNFLSPAAKLGILSSASSYNCQVVLNGVGGDSVIGSGFELIDQAFRSSNWKAYSDLLQKRTKYSSLSGEYDLWNTYPDSKKFELVLQNSLYLYFSRTPDRSIANLMHLYRSIPGNMKPSLRYFMNRYLSGLFSRLTNNSMATGNQVSILRDDIMSEYEGQIASVSFPTAIRGDLDARYQELFEDVFHPQVIRSQEEDFILGNHFGVRNRSPFMNRELLELNMAIPDAVKFGDGIGRAHLRDAMRGILPDKIRFRSTKATMTSSDGHETTMNLYEQAKPHLYENTAIWEYIDRKKFDEQLGIALNMKVPYSEKTQTYFLLTRAISLSVWLEWLKKHSSSTIH